MSEKIYALLLRLFPSHFRDLYGEEALQLFRDRAREETGFIRRTRLWLDLVVDLLISVPHECRHARQALASSSPHRLDSTPVFSVIASRPPHPGSLACGGALSLVVLFALSIGINEVRTYRVLDTRLWSAAHSETVSSAGRKSNDAASKLSRLGPPGALEQQDQINETEADTSATILVAPVEPQIDAAQRHRIIDGAIVKLKEYYIFPERAEKMAAALLAHEQTGDYNAVTDGHAFADLLTRHMRDVSHDRHLALTYSASTWPDPPSGPTAQDLARYRSAMGRTNCTFEAIKILPGKVAYLKFDEFPALSVCRKTVMAAMNRAHEASSIIFDLRENRGGSPDTVALVASYLFSQRTHVNDIYNHRKKSTHEYWTQDPIPGNKLVNKPAYILTSKSTFSGAEEFCYDLKMLKRATLVGETTAGGAHMAGEFRIDDHFKIRVPFARAINPISKTNWEGTGVEPDVKVEAAEALQVAVKLARTRVDKRGSSSRKNTRNRRTPAAQDYVCTLQPGRECDIQPIVQTV